MFMKSKKIFLFWDSTNIIKNYYVANWCLKSIIPLFFFLNDSEESPAHRRETTAKKKLVSPRQIILIGGGTGYHFTDRPFATHFEYTPIYKSIATFKLEGEQNHMKNYFWTVFCIL